MVKNMSSILILASTRRQLEFEPPWYHQERWLGFRLSVALKWRPLTIDPQWEWELALYKCYESQISRSQWSKCVARSVCGGTAMVQRVLVRGTASKFGLRQSRSWRKKTLCAMTRIYRVGFENTYSAYCKGSEISANHLGGKALQIFL